MTKSVDRDGKGRFVPGNAGKRKGTRHKTTLAVELLLDGEAEALTRKAIDLALAGDSTALRLCLERIAPPRKGRLVSVPGLPSIKGISDVPKALSALLKAIAAAELTTDEADGIASVLGRYVSAVETVAIEERLAALEERLNSNETKH